MKKKSTEERTPEAIVEGDEEQKVVPELTLQELIKKKLEEGIKHKV